MKKLIQILIVCGLVVVMGGTASAGKCNVIEDIQYHPTTDKQLKDAIVAELDKLYMFCGVYWMEKGGHLLCGQDLADKLRDSKNADIKVTVIDAVAKDFSAIAKHIAAPMVFRVDDDGEVFIKAKECEINIRSLDIHELDLEELESQCKPK